MITLDELKEWLKIDFDDDDTQLKVLINVSESTIEVATGVSKEYIQSTENETLKGLYKMAQIIIINDLYNERDNENKALTSYYIQLESMYKSIGDEESNE